jgi:hypothetical protein
MSFMPRYCTPRREKAIALRQKTPQFEGDFSAFGGFQPAHYKKQRAKRLLPTVGVTAFPIQFSATAKGARVTRRPAKINH